MGRIPCSSCVKQTNKQHRQKQTVYDYKTEKMVEEDVTLTQRGDLHDEVEPWRHSEREGQLETMEGNVVDFVVCSLYIYV